MAQYFRLLVSFSMALSNAGAQPAGSAPARSEESLLRSLHEAGRGALDVVALHHQVAAVYHTQGRWAAAELHYRSAIQLWTKGRNEAGRIKSTRSLAELYLDTGQPRKAQDLRLDRIAPRMDPASVEFAGVVGVIGSIHHAFGRYSEAEARYVESSSAFERLAPESAECLQVLNNLALLLHQTGRNSEAVKLYKGALARAASAGLRSEQVSLLANLGALKFTSDDPESALAFYQEALDLAETTLGPKHPAIVGLFENCAVILRQLNRSQEAREMDARADSIRAIHVFTVDLQGLSGGAGQLPRRR